MFLSQSVFVCVLLSSLTEVWKCMCRLVCILMGEPRVCVSLCLCVCVCQVVIYKDRNIGSPAVLTCLQGTCHQSKHSHTEDKGRLIPTKCTRLKLSEPVKK